MKRYLTGLTPSSNQLHIGNYFGALKPMIDLQKEKANEADFFIFLSNLHALTKPGWDGKQIRDNSMNLLKLYIASGVDPENFFIFKQSDVPAHAEACWIMMCVTHMGFMERMHAYKDAVAKGTSKNLSVGTFAYPILMAVDIILYDVDYVPVGKDQKQHVEYAKDIAEKFNTNHGEIFRLPEPYINEEVATIPGIDGRKMSKSYNNYIGLLEDDDSIIKKIKRIPTSNIPIEEPKDPDECNLYKMFKLFLDEQQDNDLRKRYQAGGLSYKEIKETLGETVLEFIKPIRANYEKIDDDFVNAMLQKNALRANDLANKKLEEMKKLVGFSL